MRFPTVPASLVVATAALLGTAAPLSAQHPEPGASGAESGTPELRNELANATSPYLRSAAEQPVAWQEWGPETFELARRLDRPIWLDVGAIWCHWCHVMDRESYENPEIAALINEHFVPVKVDLDERPDIDNRYQAAHIELTGRGGGWPLTMFLTPDGEPFGGGTYFPPEARDGRPGLKDIVPEVAARFHEDRGEVTETARETRERLSELGRAADADGDLEHDVVRDVTEIVEKQFDRDHGGFGNSEAAKFPHAEAIRLALARAYLRDDEDLQRSALETLEAYARSGMRDHVNGGFFRYSVDRALTVPHFEKMDYVQAAMLQAYLDAYRWTGEEGYAAVARDIMRYVDATLSDPERGGFFAHQDADVSLDDDGSYYTWSLADLEAAVPPEEFEAMRLYYDVEEDGEMSEHPDQNVLRLERTVGEVADELGIAPEEAERRIRSGTERLEAARAEWEAPFVETTVFTDRNAMLISAYLDAYTTLGDAGARDFALETLDRILEHAVLPDGSVRHAMAGEQSYVDGFMADYAGISDALLDAYQVTGESRYLRTAERVMERAVEVFWDDENGGFYDRPEDPDAPALLADRVKDFDDAPLPGDNAVAARALNKLYLLTSAERWRELAARTLAAFAGAARERGVFVASYALAAEAHLNKPPRTVVIGPAGDTRTDALVEAAWRTFRPGRTVASYDPTTVELETLPPAVAGAARVFGSDPTPRAYVCVGETCAPPTTDPEMVTELVREYGLSGSR
ncbi:MAG: thioredoxin domain-containing protein [Gemmatimonadota bacterium]|nr:thioredoxin domain-containing protein [Gemmatimonadota bacterium]